MCQAMKIDVSHFESNFCIDMHLLISVCELSYKILCINLDEHATKKALTSSDKL